jgi:hypothetical protein
MTKNLRNALLGLGTLLAAGINTNAGPLQRADVAAEPAWVLHLDFDGMRSTTVGQYIMGELEKPEAQDKFASFQAIFNFDPRKQLHGVTLYSTSQAAEDGVLVVYADFDADRLVTLAKSAHGYESTTHNQYAIHNWIDDKKKPKNGVQPRVYAAITGQRVIFGQRSSAVAAALDVIDRVSTSLAGSKTFPRLGAPSANAYVQGAARKLDLAQTDPNAAMLRMSKAARLELGESQQQVNATLSLDADSDEVAKSMLSIGQGLVGLIKLQKEKPDAVKMAEAMQFTQEGAVLVVGFNMPAADLIAMMKAEAARKAQKAAAGQ